MLKLISEDKLNQYRDALDGALKKYGNIYIFMDTETTGTSNFDQHLDVFHRVVELSCVFAYRDEQGYCHPIADKSGAPVVLDELLNPFLSAPTPSLMQQKSIKHIPSDSVGTHGITVPFLFAEEEGAGPFRREKLNEPALMFDQVFDMLTSMLSFDSYFESSSNVFGVFHNAPFDMGFLRQESEIFKKPTFESLFSPVDTLVLAKKVIPRRMTVEPGVKRPSYTLDACFEVLQKTHPDIVKNVERPIHTALIDSMITLQVFNGLNAEVVSSRNIHS